MGIDAPERDSATVPAHSDNNAAEPRLTVRPDIPPHASGLHRPRRRLRTLIGLGALAAVAGAGGIASFGVGGDSHTATPTHSPLPPTTVPVARTTLVETHTIAGTLGHGPETTLATPSVGGPDASGGILTWLPQPGSTVARGKPVYRADGQPVTLLYGDLPFYRLLGADSSGADVTELEQNLSALGYTGFTVGDKYTDAVAAAVKKWQADLGLPQTGTVAPRQVAVAPGAIRIAALKARLGGAASADVLTYTGTTRSVSVALDVGLQSLVKSGDAVTVTLPDGHPIPGTVQSVGTVATRPDNAAGGAGGGGGTTIAVAVALTDPEAAGNLDQAPVEVAVVSGKAENVLAVPVSALVALAEGGYGVQIVTGGTAHYVTVQTGLFAHGKVEIKGTDIAPGTLVGVPGA